MSQAMVPSTVRTTGKERTVPVLHNTHPLQFAGYKFLRENGVTTITAPDGWLVIDREHVAVAAALSHDGIPCEPAPRGLIRVQAHRHQGVPTVEPFIGRSCLVHGTAWDRTERVWFDADAGCWIPTLPRERGEWIMWCVTGRWEYEVTSARRPGGNAMAPRFRTTLHADGSLVHDRCGAIIGTVTREQVGTQPRWKAVPADGTRGATCGTRKTATMLALQRHTRSGCTAQSD